MFVHTYTGVYKCISLADSCAVSSKAVIASSRTELDLRFTKGFEAKYHLYSQKLALDAYVSQCVFPLTVRCSVMQCVAVCCSVLQCVTVCCSVLHGVVVCCSVL